MAENNFTQPPDDFEQPGPMIEEPVRTWSAPGAPNVNRPPVPGRVGLLKADPTKEYVSAEPNQWYLNLTRVLPFSVDDITSEFGEDLYYRMVFDPIVSNSVVTLKADVIEDGINLRPAVTESSKPGYDKAQKLLNESIDMLDEYSGGNLDDWLWEAGDAIWRGHTLTEITYAVDKALSGRTRYNIDRLSVKPLRSFGFVVDTYKRVIGIMGLVPGIGMPVYSGNIVVSPEDMPNMLPREKFAIYTHRPRDEDPRGTSILRPAYTPWSLKMQCLPEYAKWLKQFASPTLLGFTPEEAMSIPLVDPQGIPLTGTSGTPIVPLTPEQAMLNTLVQVASGSAAVFPGGSKIEPIEMKGMGNPFLLAFRWFDEQISISIMGQSMTTMPQKIGTQALGNVQQNTQDTLVHQIKAGICRMFFQDILRRWVSYTYGREYERYTPKPNLGQIEEPNLNEVLPAWASTGWQADPTQYPEIDRRLGLPPRQTITDPNAVQQTAISPTAQQQAPAPQQQAAMSRYTKAERRDLRKRYEEVQQMLEDERTKQRWHESVKMTSEVKQRFGITLNPEAAPLSAEKVLEMAGMR